MSAVCIDVCFFTSEQISDEFKTRVLTDVMEKNVLVLYAEGKFKEEVNKIGQVRSFFLQLSKRNQILKVDREVYRSLYDQFLAMEETKCAECDDPHIFSMIVCSKCEFLFSSDKRIVECRKKIRKSGRNRKFCKFKFIEKEDVYIKHREAIIKRDR